MFARDWSQRVRTNDVPQFSHCDKYLKNTIVSIWLKKDRVFVLRHIWFLYEAVEKQKEVVNFFLHAVRFTLITFGTAILKLKKKQHSLNLWSDRFYLSTQPEFCFSSRHTFSHSLDSAPELQIVPYRLWPAGPSLNGTCVTSRHFSNKASLNKPNTTLGSPLGSYRGVAEPW